MGKIYGTGMNQGDLVTLLVLIKTNINGILAKLDSDGSVTDTDYVSSYEVTVPAGIQTSGAKAIKDQGVVLTYLQSVITKFNSALAHLDADAGVNIDNDYESSCSITDSIDSTSGTLKNSGVYQGAIVNLLNAIITKVNAFNAKLDGDNGITDTNYAALWDISDTVDSAGTSA
ncbi:MAG: hypothetical protein HY548_04655 [Elusimicrobia bacterium]|nr:hypothetical protein [Elusimicrobiota bacterium]